MPLSLIRLRGSTYSMAELQLLGRGTYGPDVIVGGDVSPLWQYFRSPPAQNSILIYVDGSVLEGIQFTLSDTEDPDVDTYINGGTDYRTEEGSFQYNSLTAAGYTWRNPAIVDAEG